MTSKMKSFILKNSVAIIAIFAAIITSFIIKPSKDYLGYFDYQTLTSLFISLAVICAFKNIYFFQIVARKIVGMFKTTRSAVIALVYVTFIGSMIIANDMALITFLPLGYYILISTKQEKYMAFVFIMQNIAANLGGMLTPFGNPQNLYLFSFFKINSLEFMKIMFLPFIVSIVLITLCCFFIKKEKLELTEAFDKKLNIKRTIVYSILFLFTILIIFRTIHYLYGLVLIPILLLFLDRKSLKDVDYGLLTTFCAFFVFAGNVSRIEFIRDVVGGLLEKNTLLVGVISCQFISNVPSAILLSKFTTNYPELLVAVNIGGAGTLISSLASLITYREYVKHNPNRQFYYIKQYTLINFSFLIILFVLSLLMFNL